METAPEISIHQSIVGTTSTTIGVDVDVKTKGQAINEDVIKYRTSDDGDFDVSA
jgi:hypothetical protein